MRFSVVIPTHQRRETVLRNVAALEGQTERDFETIVVVDGSSDGTAEALRALDVSFPLEVVEQENRGAAQARNTGAAAAGGEVLLTLDDDMEPDPRMLAEHLRSHAGGADVVLGDLPIHPDSPPGMLARGVGEWARARRERLSTPGAEIRLDDLLTGQLSISRAAYEDVGGFDAGFTREGLFGGEDIDFGYRLRKAGYTIAFNPAAISFQYYDVGPRVYLRRAREAGRSDWELVAKHPELAGLMAASPSFKTRRSRWLLSPFVSAPGLFSVPLRAAAVALVRSGLEGPRATRLFFSVRTMEYLRGVRAARRRQSSGGAVVLAYHALSDLSGDPVLAEYGVPAQRFADQLDGLAARGRRFVDLDLLLGALCGRRALPAGATLITFDDAYADLLPAAESILGPRGVPAVVFAVSGRLGGANEWDRPLGAARLSLLDADGLRAVIRLGLEVGSHGVTHRPMTSLAPAEVADELEGSAAELRAAGLPRPRAFAYPHGEWNAECAESAGRAGYSVAFTIEPGVVRRGGDPLALPRVEVLAGDSPAILRLKIVTCSWPEPLRRGLLRLAGGRA